MSCKTTDGFSALRKILSNPVNAALFLMSGGLFLFSVLSYALSLIFI